MTTLRALIVEDEPDIRFLLREALRIHEDVDIVAEAESGAVGWAAARDCKPDLVFLDIRMETEDAGLQLAERLNLLRNPPHIVFLTAHEEFAIEAINQHPAYFLLKPLNEGKLAQALRWIRQHAEEKGGLGERWIFRGKIDGQPVTAYLLPGEILYFQSEGNSLSVYLVNGKVLTNVHGKALQEWESESSRIGFLRIARSYLVNRQHAQWIAPRLGETELFDLVVGPAQKRLHIAGVKTDTVRLWMAGKPAPAGKGETREGRDAGGTEVGSVS